MVESNDLKKEHEGLNPSALQSNKMKTAQDILNEVSQEDNLKEIKQEEFKKLFYKSIWEQEQIDKDISFICRKVLK